MKPNNFIDITGAKYGKLTVLSQSEHRDASGGVKWNCQCECGGLAVVAGAHLRRGKTRSCGCLIGAHMKGKGKNKCVLGNLKYDVADLDDVHDLVRW